MARKKVLITGGSGFIGRNLAECLAGKYDLSVPPSSMLDLTNAAAVGAYLKENRFDAVVHAAGAALYGKAGGRLAAEASLAMFQNVARNSRHFGKMIQLGSGAEYDKSMPIVRAREEDFGARVPADDYGLYKYRCSKYIEEAEGITCLRLFGCYGKYEDYGTRFISNAICRAIFGLPIAIANRNVVFSYLHVGDFARIVEHFIERGGEHKFYNAVPDETTDLLSIARKVDEVSGKGLAITVKNQGMGNEYSGDNSRLRQELPGFRFTPMGNGIRELYRWYGSNRAQIDRKRLGE